MKIYHVINSLGPGGAEKLVVNMAIEMKELGHDVVIITLYHENGPAYEKAKQNNLQIINLGEKKYSFSYFNVLKRLITDGHIIHAHLFPSFYYVAHLSGLRCTKVMTEHNTNNRRRGKILWKVIEEWVYSRFDKVVCISKGTLNALALWLPRLHNSKKITTILNGIEINFTVKSEHKVDIKAILGIPIDHKILICVASLTVQKNHQTILKALPNIYSADLILVGDGPLKTQLSTLAKQLNIQDRVHFLGIRNDIAELMRQSDVLVLSSLWEGFGLVIIEAMASGIPVIASDVDGINEIIEHDINGLLFNHEDPMELSVLLNNILIDSDRRNKLIEEGLMTSKKFSITNTVRSTLNLYQELIDNRG